MTGSLYHCCPLLLIARLGLRESERRFSKALVASILPGANLHGWFVLQILRGDAAYHCTVHDCLAVLHPFLLACLFVVTLAYQGEGERHTRLRRSRTLPAGKALLV